MNKYLYSMKKIVLRVLKSVHFLMFIISFSFGVLDKVIYERLLRLTSGLPVFSLFGIRFSVVIGLIYSIIKVVFRIKHKRKYKLYIITCIICIMYMVFPIFTGQAAIWGLETGEYIRKFLKLK